MSRPTNDKAYGGGSNPYVRYQQSVSCYVIGTDGIEIQQTVNVTVIVNYQTNNIVTSYIRDRAQDSLPLSCR
jgi:hypothetical protein